MVEVANLLDSYEYDQSRRLMSLRKAAEKVLPNLGNTLWVNGILSLSDHNELKIQETVEVAPLDFVATPAAIRAGYIGRFAEGFRMITGYQKINDDPTDMREREVPITMEELQDIRASRVHMEDLHRFKDHRARPAFYRAMNIAPGFIVNLTADVSSGVRELTEYGPEMLLAYRIMSRLIDSRDPFAIRRNGKADRSYLFPATLKMRA